MRKFLLNLFSKITFAAIYDGGLSLSDGNDLHYIKTNLTFTNLINISI